MVRIASSRLAPTGIDAIAVLPFSAANQSNDTEYLTDGISESLINGLAQLPDLRVSARSVVFKYKNKEVDPQEVGRDARCAGDRHGPRDRARRPAAHSAPS